MGIVNTRNALVGWLAVKVGKRVVKSKAKGALPGGKNGRRRVPIVSGLAAAALAGAAWVVRRRKRGGGEAADA
jgi:hypothetical protein